MKVKQVATHDADGKENGFLVELYKDWNKTLLYLTAARVGAFKGYHLHRIRKARYVCIKGKMKITTYIYSNDWKKWEGTETILELLDTMTIDRNVATGLENIGDEEAWLINYPDPAYDPELKDEQIEYTLEELQKGVIK